MNKNYFIGIGFKLLNCLIFPTMSLLMVVSVSLVPIMQVFFLQVFLGAIFSFLFLFVIDAQPSFSMSRRDLFLYLGRSITNLLAMKLWIFALTTTGMNEATALGYTGPLWVFLMARYIIGEKFGFSILGLIFINIIGMLIIIQPKYVDLHWQGIAASLGAILLWSLYEIICKIQTSTQHYMQQTFYFMAISAIIVAPFAYNSWKSLNIQESNMMIVLALLAVANITAIFIAYSHAPITLLSPFSYARLIFTVILTSSLYNIIPAPHTFIGAAVIFLSNGYFIYKINKKSLN